MIMQTRTPPIKQHILMGFAVPIGIALLVAAFTYISLRASGAAANEVSKQEGVQNQTHLLLESAIDNETGFRGFVITGKESFLEPLRTGRSRFDRVMGRLSQIDPGHEQALQELQTLMHDKLQRWQDSIMALRQQTTPASIQQVAAAVSAGTEKSYMDELRSRVAALSAASEAQLQSSRQLDREAKANVVRIVLGGLFLSALGALFVGLFLASRITRTVQDAISSVTSTSAEIAATVEQHERSALVQASSVHETSATMAELEASFRQAEHQAETASASARQANALAEQGNTTIQQTLQGMEMLKQKVGGIAEQILRLSEHSSQIGAITSLVTDLANQTNLLALNAAVEAARVGEHGRGFAVVAAEIRKLADESKRSAERISGLVGDIQRATTATVMATEEGTKVAEHGRVIAQRTAEAFNGVSEAVNDLVESAQQTMLNLRQQAAAVRQVTEAMQALRVGASETTSGISQTKLGIGRLNQAAQNLQAIV